MGKFDKYNAKVPRGCGKCSECHGTGYDATDPKPRRCLGCRSSGTCRWCDGTGILGKASGEPPHNCVFCDNNYERFNDDSDPFWINRLIYGDNWHKSLQS